MKRTLPLAILLATAAIAATGCDHAPTSKTSYNNSGTDATAAQPAADNGSPAVTTTVTTQNTANQGDNAAAPAATPDSSSTNVASTAQPYNASNGAAAGAVSETVTTGKIKAALAADSAMKDSDISVTTKDGVVSLNGTVKSQDQVSIATNLAQRQEGVQRVESNVTVR